MAPELHEGKFPSAVLCVNEEDGTKISCCGWTAELMSGSMNKELPLTPGEQPCARYASKPLILCIGNTRYRIESAVEITALRPRRAEVIPIDRARNPGIVQRTDHR